MAKAQTKIGEGFEPETVMHHMLESMKNWKAVKRQGTLPPNSLKSKFGKERHKRNLKQKDFRKDHIILFKFKSVYKFLYSIIKDTNTEKEK